MSFKSRFPLGAALVLMPLACTLAYPLGGYDDGAQAAADAGLDANAIEDGGEAAPPDGDAAATENDPDPSPMLAYASGAAIRYRRWNAATSSWSAPADGPAIASGRDVRGVALKRSTVNGRRTLAVYTVAGGVSDAELAVYDWIGGSFREAFRARDFGARPEWRTFDLACDGKSGNTYVVYSNATTGSPRLRSRDDRGWTEERGAFADSIGETLTFTELVTRPGTDDMTLLYVDGSRHFAAARLAGNGFEPPARLAGTISVTEHKAFAGAYESKSGDLFVTWAAEGTFNWNTVPPGAAAIPPAMSEPHPDVSQTGVMAVAADPSSDRIALALLESVCGMKDCDDWSLDMWNGAGLDGLATLDGDITQSYAGLEANAPIAVGWAGGQAVAVYFRDADGFRWGRWRDGKWVLQPPFVPRDPIGPKASFVTFRSGSDLVLLIEELSGKLWAKRFDGTSWSDTEGAGPLAEGLPNPDDFNGITFAIDAP
ncbi:MAG: hypothetical protein KIT84_12000 [Labilithrix sp.]|nr:hypothetical protein [Labilithrix sp.]MCW5811734.1 hypothetical protein [Labilithrix sp.]